MLRICNLCRNWGPILASGLAIPVEIFCRIQSRLEAQAPSVTAPPKVVSRVNP